MKETANLDIWRVFEAGEFPVGRESGEQLYHRGARDLRVISASCVVDKTGRCAYVLAHV